MSASVKNYFIFKTPVVLMGAAIACVLSSSAFADPAPDTLFGNYAGTGKCPPGSPKSCTDTGAMDNVFLQHLEKKETDEQVQVRNLLDIKKTDTHVAIRILRNNGHNCTMEGEMLWSGDHLSFQEGPVPRGTIPANCRLQLGFKHDGMTIKDPDNACSEGYCSIDKPTRLAGRRFKKGPDQLLAANKKSATPPPAAIFGKYDWAGKCASDERKTVYCTARNKSTDYVIIKPSETADARVVIGRTKSADDDGSSFCRMDADAMWLGNHLTFIKELPDSPGSPQLLEFWFKDNTLVVRDVWNNHCGALIQGGYFKKSPASPRRPAQR